MSEKIKKTLLSFSTRASELCAGRFFSFSLPFPAALPGLESGEWKSRITDSGFL